MSRRTLSLLLLPAWLLALDAMALDDPMRPPQVVQSAAKTARTSPGFTLTSTFIARDERRAVLNGKTVHIGDHVAGARVESIEATQVLLRRGGSDIIVRLLPTRVKQPAASDKQEQQ
ncbi:MAG: hypothetical protein AB7U81_05435 [Thiohalomonadaceae bacterium]